MRTLFVVLDPPGRDLPPRIKQVLKPTQVQTFFPQPSVKTLYPRVLRRLSRMTVIGITDHSLTQFYILLAATVPADAGYFGERLAAARAQLVRAWKPRSSKLSPKFRQTEILGALALAEQICSLHPTLQKRLLIYSDMLNSSPELDLRKGTIGSNAFQWLDQNPIPDLHNVTVTILGTASTYKTTADWVTVRDLWIDYFRRTGASATIYSPLRAE